MPDAIRSRHDTPLPVNPEGAPSASSFEDAVGRDLRLIRATVELGDWEALDPRHLPFLEVLSAETVALMKAMAVGARIGQLKALEHGEEVTPDLRELLRARRKQLADLQNQFLRQHYRGE